MFASVGVDRYQAGERDVVYTARTLDVAGRRAVLRLPGYNGTPLTDQYDPNGNRTITDRGMPVMVADWSGSAHWGNDTAQTRVGTGRTYMQASPWSAKSGKVLLLGHSMGGLLALLYALGNPGNVQAVAVSCAAVSPIDIHDNDRGSYAASIETAYGGLAGWNAAKATHDPVTRAAEYGALGIPTKLWYSDNDPICVKAQAQAFVAASGCESVNMGTIATNSGHDVYAAFSFEAADWLAARA